MRESVETPIGRMVMTSDGEALTGLCLEHWWWDAGVPAAAGPIGPRSGAGEEIGAGDERFGDDHARDDHAGDDRAGVDRAVEVFRLTRRWLDDYFAGRDPGFLPPMNPAGSAFRREVWEVVAEIPYGRTMSYGQIAAELSERRGGRRMAAQAVGGAVKHNPITIIVPCHRVVGAGRSFGGYGGRLDIKAALLDHEGVDLGRFDLPQSACPPTGAIR
ncbi:methylated-DNA--[protein]-cysteine S-methyltransferase [Bifidobacterium simiarum]|uniref:methylated-DNA--[protein]-cysteine S-methyltransferase n=1 Tax=Bifidobacterium simiarum TaxID=2045441 RepID=A0A2M9HGI5_9BIFI|nr:methylated-DNA--[protein]-cysteine S-methyltransferase [Bifidobacterium simiarum]PJM75938.1 cysteine methyltransferase [Bifidobacterium simiarum]